MRWSKLKQRIEERLIDDIRPRIRVDLTKYHWTKNEYGELVVLLDGKVIYSASQWASLRQTDGEYFKDWIGDFTCNSQGLSTEHDAPQALFISLNLSVDDMLSHVNPLIRGFGIIDTRCGKRRLSAMNPETEHPFVAKMIEQRIPLKA